MDNMAVSNINTLKMQFCVGMHKSSLPSVLWRLDQSGEKESQVKRGTHLFSLIFLLCLNEMK